MELQDRTSWGEHATTFSCHTEAKRRHWEIDLKMPRPVKWRSATTPEFQ